MEPCEESGVETIMEPSVGPSGGLCEESNAWASDGPSVEASGEPI